VKSVQHEKSGVGSILKDFPMLSSEPSQNVTNITHMVVRLQQQVRTSS